MCAQHSHHERSLVSSVLGNRCPRCREGRLFTSRNPYNLKTTMRMPGHCPVCGQAYELETGFYFGTGYVSYGLCVVLMGALFAACGAAGLIHIYDNSVYYILVANAVMLIALQPLLQRISRSIWIAFFVKYDPNAAAHPLQ